MTTFEELGLKGTILTALNEIGFREPFPIQAGAIPVLLSGQDVIGQAHTGTGKTAAFSLPIIQNVTPRGGVQALIIAPTRELAVQISDEITKFSRHSGIRNVTIYGGQSMNVQLQELSRGVEIVVATPGRLIDHIKRGSIKLQKVKWVVLDEADTMLDMGFIEDIKFVLDLVPEDHINALFSATMPAAILMLAEKYMKNPQKIFIDSDDLSGEGIEQAFLVIKDREKTDYLFKFIKENGAGQTIVFCSTKDRTRRVAHELEHARFNTVSIQGDMSQFRRDKAMYLFKKGKADILVATDVAARGIDVPKVALVINYDVPNQDMVYFHRIGRTARAGEKGRAITLVSYSSIGDFKAISNQTKVQMKDLNKELGIEVNIPDPLKREVHARRSFGRPGGGYRSGGGYGRSGGGYGRGGDRRDRRRSGDRNYYGLRSRW
ncbi:DEAD/DEAH box helicase domain protein [Nitrosotalea sinensis]|uniref:DEAD/DEAH box helicase domain protein n=1 Tax=Nitrosotalea sinensis TaxID=1499975 RepID=A0A2H1EE72_9ARCH|nr:DEAD/DEAH box helicase [Candidatus Nitrosotalea sinensis]SHO42730.1 DEAD/DEAH box helicase domain protein [Candidatus Nitrosotalea sinensis]